MHLNMDTNITIVKVKSIEYDGFWHGIRSKRWLVTSTGRIELREF